MNRLKVFYTSVLMVFVIAIGLIYIAHDNELYAAKKHVTETSFVKIVKNVENQDSSEKKIFYVELDNGSFFLVKKNGKFVPKVGREVMVSKSGLIIKSEIAILDSIIFKYA
jgi:hypothetical protein